MKFFNEINMAAFKVNTWEQLVLKCHYQGSTFTIVTETSIDSGSPLRKRQIGKFVFDRVSEIRKARALYRPYAKVRWNFSAEDLAPGTVVVQGASRKRDRVRLFLGVSLGDIEFKHRGRITMDVFDLSTKQIGEEWQYCLADGMPLNWHNHHV